MPCVPAAGMQAGMLVVPSIGAGVWIEFEQGDPDYPIWTGCFWGSAAELPDLADLSPPGLASLTFQTTLQNGIVVNDAPESRGRHHPEEHHRRLHHRQRHRHLHLQRPGRHDHAGRADRGRQ